MSYFFSQHICTWPPTREIWILPSGCGVRFLSCFSGLHFGINRRRRLSSTWRLASSCAPKSMVLWVIKTWWSIPTKPGYIQRFQLCFLIWSIEITTIVYLHIYWKFVHVWGSGWGVNKTREGRDSIWSITMKTVETRRQSFTTKRPLAWCKLIHAAANNCYLSSNRHVCNIGEVLFLFLFFFNFFQTVFFVASHSGAWQDMYVNIWETHGYCRGSLIFVSIILYFSSQVFFI